jgi:hypothetical protein
VPEGRIKQQAGRNCPWKSSASVVVSAQVGVRTMSLFCRQLRKFEVRDLVARELLQFEEFRGQWPKWRLGDETPAEVCPGYKNKDDIILFPRIGFGPEL